MTENVRRIPKKDFKNECPYCKSKNVDKRLVIDAAAPCSGKLSEVYETGVRFCFDCREVFLLVD